MMNSAVCAILGLLLVDVIAAAPMKAAHSLVKRHDFFFNEKQRQENERHRRVDERIQEQRREHNFREQERQRLANQRPFGGGGGWNHWNPGFRSFNGRGNGWNSWNRPF